MHAHKIDQEITNAAYLNSNTNMLTKKKSAPNKEEHYFEI